MTFYQMQEIVRSAFPEYPLTLIKLDLNAGYKDFCSKTGLPRKSYNLATGASSATIEIPKRIYAIITDGVVTTFESVGFSTEPTYTVTSDTLTILSNAELNLEGMVFANNEDYSIGTSTTSELDIIWPTLAGNTISVIWQYTDTIETTTSALTNDNTYTLSTDVDRVYEVEVLNSNSTLVDDISWGIDNRIITLYDTYGYQLTTIPANIYSITIYYHAIPTNMSADTAIPELPEQFHYALIEYVFARYYRRKGDFNNAKFALQTYEQLVREGKQYCNINGTSRHTVSEDTILNLNWISTSVITSGSDTAVTNNRIPSGPTASRPTLTATDVGYIYFDTDMSSPIWWNGVNWV